MVEQDVVREQKIEFKEELDIRRKVDEILQESREAPNRDGSIALERLRKDYPND